MQFHLDKPPGYKVLCELGTLHYKKVNKSVLNTITISLEDVSHEKVDLNGETLTFTLHLVKF